MLWRLVVLLTFTILGITLKAAEAPSHLQVGLGVFNVNRKAHKAPQFLIEYRRNINYHHVRPLVAFTFTDRGSYFLCAGAGLDVFLGKYLVVTPSFAPGLYVKGHKGKELGSVLEFRSSIELAAVLPNKGRIGAQYYHISNASLGYKNPGSESLIIFYAIPL